MSQALKANKINYIHARNVSHGIQIKVATPGDHRTLSVFFRKERIGYHTYALQEERKLRVVIRGVPKEFDVGQVQKDLIRQAYPVVSVHRMHSRRDNFAYNMVLVVLEPTPEGRLIGSCLRTVCGLSGITVEAPHRPGTPGQCRRCQLYGHSSRNCYAKPRCVKCLGDHATAQCSRIKDTAIEPPSCVLCQQQGHTANYRGCPKAPRKSLSNCTAPRTVGTRTSAPRVPKPVSVPVAVPTVSTRAKPLPSTGPGMTSEPPLSLSPRTASLPAYQPPQPSVVGDYSSVLNFIRAVDFDRLRSLADAISRSTTHEQRLDAARRHSDVYEAVSRTLD